MICFAWGGFPQYAARLVGAFAGTSPERVVVAGKKPAVPVEGMEKYTKCELKWVSPYEKVSLYDLFGEWPRVLFTTGWCWPAFNHFRDQVRAHGGKVVAMVDNNYDIHGLKDWMREILKAIRFRLFLRSKYDAFFVVGKSGRRILRFWGAKDEQIYEGLYAADETLFTPGPPIAERPKKMIYVGQLCERKNVRRLCEAFGRSLEVLKFRGLDVGTWSLEIYGCGPLKDELLKLPNLQTSKLPNLHIHGFMQPEELAAKYREARIFILPSLEEHWGLVVHEAALSGCVLLLSNRVGAADDLLKEGVNGYSFDPFDVDDMADKMARAMVEAETLDVAAAQKIAAENATQRFAAVVRRIVHV